MKNSTSEVQTSQQSFATMSHGKSSLASIQENSIIEHCNTLFQVEEDNVEPKRAFGQIFHFKRKTKQDHPRDFLL